MKEDCDSEKRGTPWWLEALIPSVPPTLTAVVGFFIFHKLAVRRQIREEVRQVCDRFKLSSQEIAKSSYEAWEKSGREAVDDGCVVIYKGNIFVADNIFHSLTAYSENFIKIKEYYSDLKRACDEKIEGETRVSIEDMSRTADRSYPTIIRKKLALLLRKVDEVFVDRF